MPVPTATVETAIPFAFGSDGHVSVETDPQLQADQHVKSLVATDRGERLVYIDYGAGLTSQVFESDVSTVRTQMTLNIREALARWEPSIALHSVNPVMDPTGSSLIDVHIDYVRGDAADNPAINSPSLNRGVLRPGSGVTEVIRG